MVVDGAEGWSVFVLVTVRVVGSIEGVTVTTTVVTTVVGVGALTTVEVTVVCVMRETHDPIPCV